MGHDEETNNFNGGENSINPPVAPNPRAQITNNRLGMRPARNLSAMDELNRITEDENRQKAPVSETGDIVLNADVKQPKDKKIIIIIVLAILVVAVFAFGLIMTKGKGLNTNTGQTALGSESVSSFKDFAKYYLGDDANFSDDYSPSIAYKVDDAIESKDATFFDEANKKLESFTATVPENAEDSIKTLVNSYKKAFSFAYNYGLSTFPTEDDILKKYNADGKEATINYINDAYSRIINIDYNNSNMDVANEIGYYVEMVNLHDLYAINGCVLNGMDNESCLSLKIGQEALTSAYKTVSEAKKKRGSLEKYVGYSKSLLWDLNDAMNGVNK